MMTQKFINQYMNLARQIARDNSACFSRQIGVVIVDPIKNQIETTGYNGPPTGTPHCNDLQYLNDYWWPQLSLEEKRQAAKFANVDVVIDNPKREEIIYNCNYRYQIINIISQKSICPRRAVNAASGQRLDLCSCAHAERNAIERCGRDLSGCEIFCYCGIPCIECTKAIIQAKIQCAYYLGDPNVVGNVVNAGGYIPSQSEWLLKQAKVKLIKLKELENGYEIING